MPQSPPVNRNQCGDCTFRRASSSSICMEAFRRFSEPCQRSSTTVRRKVRRPSSCTPFNRTSNPPVVQPTAIISMRCREAVCATLPGTRGRAPGLATESETDGQNRIVPVRKLDGVGVEGPGLQGQSERTPRWPPRPGRRRSRRKQPTHSFRQGPVSGYYRPCTPAMVLPYQSREG